MHTHVGLRDPFLGVSFRILDHGLIYRLYNLIYIGLIYGMYLQFGFLKWPLIRVGLYFIVSQ